MSEKASRLPGAPILEAAQRNKEVEAEFYRLMDAVRHQVDRAWKRFFASLDHPFNEGVRVLMHEWERAFDYLRDLKEIERKLKHNHRWVADYERLKEVGY